MSIRNITPPTTEPISVFDIEAQIQFELPDDQVALVEGYISAVRQRCELELRRALITSTWELVADAFPYPTSRNPFAAAELPLPPLQSIVSVKYLNSSNVMTTLDAADYVVDLDSTPGRVIPAYGKTWPATLDFPGAVRIQFTTGYGDPADVPQCVKQWMLLNVANLYENRETESVVNGRGVVIDLSTLADSLLDPERWEVRV